MKESSNRKTREFRSRFEWAIVKREKATGKIIKTVALEPDMKIPEDASNFSEYIRNLIKQDLERRKQDEPTITAASEPQATRVELTDAERLLYTYCMRYFHEFGRMEYGSSYEYFPLQPDQETLLCLVGDVYDLLKKNQYNESQQDKKATTEEALEIIRNIKDDKELWSQLYNKFSTHWCQENPIPEEFMKEVVKVDGKAWTRYEVLEHCMPERNEKNELSVRKIAEIFHVSYQKAYNKVVPIIEPVLKEAGAKIV